MMTQGKDQIFYNDKKRNRARNKFGLWLKQGCGGYYTNKSWTLCGLPLTGNLPDAQGECREQETVPRYFKMQEALSPKKEANLETLELLEKLFITSAPCWIRRTRQTWISCSSIRITQQNLIRNYKEQKETVGGSNTQWMSVVYRNQRRSDATRVTCWRRGDRAE